MATYVLVPGADGTAWYWHLVAPELRAAGQDVVLLDLPAQDSADLDDIADAIAGAASDALAAARRDGRESGPLVLVAQSLAGFSAPLVCGRLHVDRMVLVNAMVPRPGESAGEWWEATGQPAARLARAEADGRRGPDAEFDLRTDFFHDVPPAVTEEAFAAAGSPPSAVFAQPWPLEKWPDVPTRFLQGVDDRFFPLDFQRRVVRERLGLDVEELPGGHLLALSHPRELAAALLREA
jgi:hypothetical protein